MKRTNFSNIQQTSIHRYGHIRPLAKENLTFEFLLLLNDPEALGHAATEILLREEPES